MGIAHINQRHAVYAMPRFGKGYTAGLDVDCTEHGAGGT